MTVISSAQSKLRWTLIVAALLVTVLGSAFRAHELATAPYARDEFFTAAYADTRRFDFINPAYYFLAHLSTKVVGDTEFANRLPAFLFGSLTLPLFFFCFRQSMTPGGALAGAMLLAISAWHLEQSQNARFYTGVVFFLVLATYFYIQGFRSRNKLFLFGHLVAIVIAILFHATAAVLAGSFVAVSLMLYALPSFFQIDAAQRRLAGLHSAIGLVALIVCIPVALQLLGGWQASRQSWGRSGVDLILQMANHLGPSIAVAAAAGAAILWIRDRLLALALVVPILISGLVFLALSFSSSVRPDYLIGILPLVLALAGIFCTWPAGPLKVLKQLGIFSIIAAAALPSTVSTMTQVSTFSVKDAIAFVESNFTTGDFVLNFVDGFAYYSSLGEVIDNSLLDPFTSRADWPSVLRNRLAASRTWVVVPVRRSDIDPGLFAAMTCRGKLVWRHIARRFDYTDIGAEIYLIDWRLAPTAACATMRLDGK